jgi:drug/metabolite transporter (DMT)-like permease
MGIQFLPIAGLPKETDQAKATTPALGACSLATLSCLLSAGVYIAAKAVATEMPPWTLCFWRVLLAGLILLPALWPHWRAVVTTVRQRWLTLLVIGGLGLAIT